MRRTVLLLASTALALLLVSVVAWAITKDCKAGADYCVGTNKPDTLNGSDVRDKIYGQDANDKLYGNGGNDTLSGGDGSDLMSGGAGDDRVSTVQGNDRIYGSSGNDDLSDWVGRNKIYGGSGNDALYGIGDVLDGGPGNDDIVIWDPDARAPTAIYGGPGEDEIRWGFSNTPDKVHKDTYYVRDGERDTVACGRASNDTVYFDKGIDSVNPFNCEKRIGK